MNLTDPAFLAMDKRVQEAQAIILRLELALSEALQPVGGGFYHIDHHGTWLVVTDSALHIGHGGQYLSVELPPGVRLGFVNTGGSNEAA